MAGYLRACDVVLIPSLEEGLPNLGMEAQACGKPILASDAWGLPEIVTDGETGLLFRAGSVGDLGRAISVASRQTDVLARWGRRAREHAEARFDAKRYAPRMMALYRRALAEPLYDVSALSTTHAI
jgi:glycosyltransferase involved in cell wall biosynthesis